MMSGQSKLKMAIVGCGGIGRHYHLPNLAKDPRVELVVACDLIEDRAVKACRAHGIPHYETDYKKALSDYELDAVTVCTSNDAHAPVSIFAAEKGLHVMCEKPLARNLEEAEAMLAAVTKANVVHMVDFSKRFPEHSRHVKALIDSKTYGKVYSIAVDYYQGYRADPHCPMAWRVRKSMAGSGVLGDLGSHAIDLVRFWIGEPDSVVGFARTLVHERPSEDLKSVETVDCDDLAFIAGVTTAGVPYSVRTTWNRAGTGDELRAEIHMEKATLLWRMHSPEQVAVLERSGDWSTSEVRELEAPKDLRVDPFRKFVDHCLSRTPVDEPNFVDGVRVQRILDSILAQS